MRTDPETRITELLAHANKREQRMREAERKARRLVAKVEPVTGKVTRRPDGKILKPEGWQPPGIAGALGIHKLSKGLPSSR